MFRKAILFFMAFSSFFINCGNDNPSGQSAIASESWRLYDVASVQNYTDITMSKLSNGAISAQGAWFYFFYGTEISCTVMSGAADIIDTTASINMRGIASYPPDSSGPIYSSPFNLQMSGIFKAGNARGTWKIDFDDSTWQGWINPDQFTGKLQIGSGVTAP